MLKINNIAIFASGSGSNAEQIIRYFSDDPATRVRVVLSNNKGAFALERARKFGVPTMAFDRHQFYQTNLVRDHLNSLEIDLIVLAGFMWLIPPALLEAYPGRILNIHPALLPAFGGKGMYGHHVHEAVIASGVRKSGITIHLVDEVYDHGSILFQAECEVWPDDTPDALAARIHELEHRHYPGQIKRFLQSLDAQT
ncbi:MAG: phosphoribosylglycinamide formyltransferase [Bacteroidales bacterium]